MPDLQDYLDDHVAQASAGDAQRGAGSRCSRLGGGGLADVVDLDPDGRCDEDEKHDASGSDDVCIVCTVDSVDVQAGKKQKTEHVKHEHGGKDLKDAKVEDVEDTGSIKIIKKEAKKEKVEKIEKGEDEEAGSESDVHGNPGIVDPKIPKFPASAKLKRAMGKAGLDHEGNPKQLKVSKSSKVDYVDLKAIIKSMSGILEILPEGAHGKNKPVRCRACTWKRKKDVVFDVVTWKRSNTWINIFSSPGPIFVQPQPTKITFAMDRMRVLKMLKGMERVRSTRNFRILRKRIGGLSVMMFQGMLVVLPILLLLLLTGMDRMSRMTRMTRMTREGPMQTLQILKYLKRIMRIQSMKNAGASNLRLSH